MTIGQPVVSSSQGPIRLRLTDYREHCLEVRLMHRTCCVVYNRVSSPGTCGPLILDSMVVYLATGGKPGQTNAMFRHNHTTRLEIKSVCLDSPSSTP
jgi:hypothetical protein